MNCASQHHQKATFQLAIGFFLLAALLGALMRFMYLQEISFLDYRHILHAHSHLAMLGWGFTALGGALVFLLLKNVNSYAPYRKTLIGNLIAGVGMFFAFLYQGYGAISIAFSTLHVLVAYYFAWHFLKALKTEQKTNATKFAKWAVYLMLLSTAGIWAVAPISMFLGKLHPLYYASVQFFLHLQFNGWFTYGIIALLFKHAENNGQNVQLPKYTFALLQISVVLTYALSITWSTPETTLFYLNSVGVLVQLLAFLLLWRGFSKTLKFNFRKVGIAHWLIRMGIISLAFKVVAQGAVAMPFVAKISYTIRNFVIGFIHLTMLGAFSLTIVAILLFYRFLPNSKLAQKGYKLLIAGYVLTEIILFLQGLMLWAEQGFLPFYHELLFALTLILPLSLILIYKSFNHLNTQN